MYWKTFVAGESNDGALVTDTLDRLKVALADRYTIEHEIGQGGMATVFLAEDIKHKRKVAIKLLKPELAAVLGAERFVQEITTTAALQHPHILPLFDSGTADGFLYYVMPFIDGETLRDTLNRETQLGVDDAIRITSEVADALDYAHRNGVIHRDIKPENILMHDGRPMVADFGIALAVSAAAGGRMTETGLSLGTPHYMSPEQATAEKEITARSDVYSLGSVLYEMLTGEPPHMGNSAQAIIMKIVTEEAAPVTKLRKAVPPNVAAAVAKSLEKLAADRFESAKAFGEALKDKNFATIAMPAVAGVTGNSRWRNALIGGLVTGAVAGVVAAKLVSPADEGNGRIERAQLTFSGQAHTPAISPDGERVAYIINSCEPGAVACTVSLEVLEVGGTKAQVLIPEARILSSPRWSHDGETLVVGGEFDEGRLGVFSIPRLNGTLRLIHQGAYSAYDTHPLADSVVVIGREVDSMMVVGLHDGKIHARIGATFQQVADISWSPDGGRIAVNDGAGLHIVSRDGTLLGTGVASARSSLRWSTGGEALVYFRTGRAREDDLVRRQVLDDGSLSETEDAIMPRTPTMYDGDFDIARRGGQVVIKTGDAITDVWSFDLGQRPVVGVRETHGTTWYGDPVPSLDGKTLYYYRGDALGDNVYRLDRDTGTEEALTAEPGPGSNAVKMSSDGGRLVYTRTSSSGRSLVVMELPSRRISSRQASTSYISTPITPRGYLSVSEISGALMVIDSLDGEWRMITDPDSVTINSIAATPDGQNALFTGWLNSADGSSERNVLASVPILGGPVRELVALEETELSPGLSVGGDGTIYLARWLAGEQHPSLWRVPSGGGIPSRMAEIPEGCRPDSLTVGWSGEIAVCGVDDYRSDVWMIDLGAATQ